jgi:hypothetical protein
MKPFSELTGRGRLVEVLRWLCVLPAAVLVHTALELVVEATVQIASFGGWGIFGDSNIAYLPRLFLFYVSPKAAFVIAGAKTAPRYQRATAIVLTLLGFLFSLLTHVISQHRAGRRVGITNYTHLLAESVGLLVAAAYIVLEVRKNMPRSGGSAAGGMTSGTGSNE